MNYELAKKLKDAGFPQKYKQTVPNCDFAYKEGIEELKMLHIDTDTDWWLGDNYAETDMPDEVMQKDWVKCPTLSELIEELGSDFGGLHRSGDGFYAFEFHCCDEDKGVYTGEYSYAEEAVAHLWLELNKQP